ncbi:MAG: RagB/SusD family nutrient uptake outer membrane protein [Macellibacteroides sp.]|uniref:RagB/SusD family nutrient uptake outer membrane protein n=1 Tax=Macellibacteroides TaxID=1159323 RepID=UPI003E79F006
MKKIKNIAIALMASTVLLSGCSEDYMETSPTDQVSETIVSGSLDNLYIALNGIHRSLVRQYLSSQSCGGEPSMNIYRDVLGDDLVHPSTGNSWFLSDLRWVSHRNPNATSTKYPFYIYYQFILNANLILQNVDKVQLTDQKLHDGVKGEALCFRAWSHFNLVQLYAKRYDPAGSNSQLGVPYRKEANTDGMARNTVEECYQFINEDLDEAIELLKNYTAKATTHFSLKVAYGLKARVLLTMGNYPEAAKFADLSIKTAEADGNKLMNSTELMSGFATILTDTDEAMWAANTQDDQTIYFYSFYAYMSWNFNASAIRAVPRCINSVLYNKISNTDIRKKWWDPTGTAAVPATTYKKYKYQNRKFTAKATSNSVGDYAYMRLAEMYLIKAEALARSGQVEEAQNTFTKFAITRDPSYVASSTTKEQLAEEIMIHRRVELWGEGFRFTDLKRLNLPLDRTGSNHEAAIAIKLSEPAGSKEWQYMIPQDELNANPLMTQNE